MAKWKELPPAPSPEAIVKAALERAAMCVERFRGVIYHPEDLAASIRYIADNPAAVAAIIKKAGEDRG